ncbi:MAG: hypothetical protein ACOY0T_03115 [Myxococcota bacterium]
MDAATVFHLLVVLLAFLLMPAALVFTRRRLLHSESLLLFRCLWPSWRFFDAVFLGPELCVRVASASGELSEWQPVLHTPQRRVSALVLNARGNLELAYWSLCERLLAELEEQPEGADATALVSYELVQRLIRSEIRERTLAGGTYQFRLRDPLTHEVWYESNSHPVNA